MKVDIQNKELVLSEYGFNSDQVILKPFGSGHINATFLLTHKISEAKFILQSINTNVFKRPDIIAQNVKLVGDYLAKHYPNYLFVNSLPTVKGEEMVVVDGFYWRLTHFVTNSISFDTLSEVQQAFEAALQFGRLNKLLSNFDASQLKETIPGFHDLGLRYQQFLDTLELASDELKINAEKEIKTALDYRFILDNFNSIKENPEFPDRAMHHDTKISNMLFDKDTLKGKCVIDLDTLMAGKFISDLGDMMRTYLCAYSENEPDINKVSIRIEYFEAIVKGYLQEMGSILSPIEKELIVFSGKYIIYMQAIRFLSDYLNGSIYYPIAYPEQNLDRTKNQFKLLSELFNNEEILDSIVNKCLKEYDLA